MKAQEGCRGAHISPGTSLRGSRPFCFPFPVTSGLEWVPLLPASVAGCLHSVDKLCPSLCGCRCQQGFASCGCDKQTLQGSLRLSDPHVLGTVPPSSSPPPPDPGDLSLSAALATFCFVYKDQPLRLRRSWAGVAGIRHHKMFWMFIWWEEC